MVFDCKFSHFRDMKQINQVYFVLYISFDDCTQMPWLSLPSLIGEGGGGAGGGGRGGWG